MELISLLKDELTENPDSKKNQKGAKNLGSFQKKKKGRKPQKDVVEKILPTVVWLRKCLWCHAEGCSFSFL